MALDPKPVSVTPSESSPGPKLLPSRGRIRLRMDRGNALEPEFTPLSLPSELSLVTERLSGNAIEYLYVELRAELAEGLVRLPIADDQDLEVMVPPNARCDLWISANRGLDPSSRKTMVTAAELVFTPALTLRNVFPVLAILHRIFDDRGVAAVRDQVTRFVQGEGAAWLDRMQQDWTARLENGLAGMAPPGGGLGFQIEAWKTGLLAGAERLKAQLLGGAALLRHELRQSGDRLPRVELARASAHPVQRGGEWHLELRFSGEFGYPDAVMRPFTDVVLPRAILPQPHALLESLLSEQPLASATVLTEAMDAPGVARALGRIVTSAHGHFEVQAVPPGVGVDWPTPDLGRLIVDTRVPERVTVKGQVAAQVEAGRAEATLASLELGVGGKVVQLAGTVSATRTAADDDAPVLSTLLGALASGDWPLPGVALEAQATLAPGSELGRVEVSASMTNPLTTGGLEIDLALDGLGLDGEVTLAVPPGERLPELTRARLAFRAGVQSLPRTEFADGPMRVTPEELSGQVAGTVERGADGGLVLVVDGSTDLRLDVRSQVDGFPELKIEPGELRATLAAQVEVSARARTRTGADAIAEADLAGSRVVVRLTEAQAALGGRMLALPPASRVELGVADAVIRASGLGHGAIDVAWDLGGQSPVLSAPGRAVEIFVPELRQGALTIGLSQVGGVTVTGPQGGLFDAHFFNALVNPGEEAQRWLDILRSDEAVDKVVAAVRIFHDDAAEKLEEARDLVRRVRRILDEEKITQPGDFVPARAMARVAARVIQDGSADLEERLYALVQQVVDGRGLDVPVAKRLLSEYLPEHELDFELDRGLRWLSKVLAPTAPLPPRETITVVPLAEDPRHTARFLHLPSAGELYRRLRSPEPLDRATAGRIAHVAPYLTLDQVDFILAVDRSDWPSEALARLKAVRAVKDRVRLIKESYGGIAFLPQAYAISFFLGDAVRERPGPDPFAPAIRAGDEAYRLGTGLLGPREVAWLLQSGLASFWQGAPVQINQRLLLDYVLRQPPSFTREVLVEMADRVSRALTGVLYALMQLQQDAILEPLDVDAVLSERLGVLIPDLADYLAGGRWARESHYEALSRAADLILSEAEPYLALKAYLQTERHPVPIAVADALEPRTLQGRAEAAIAEADKIAGRCQWKGEEPARRKHARQAYEQAFEACRALLAAQPGAFQLEAIKAFWGRTFEALTVLGVVRNWQEDVDTVRGWLATRLGADPPEDEQGLVDAVIDALYYFPADRAALKADPLVRLLLDPEPGRYRFTVVSAMGVITDGERGRELEDAYRRLEERRGVRVIRADTRTARSLEFNAARLEEAVRRAETPWGYIGYSQGCANGLMLESRLLGGTPDQQALARGLRCRNLLFSAANGSAHGQCGDEKFLQAMIDLDRILKHYQGVFSSRAINLALRTIGQLLDSRPFVHSLGGIQSLSPEGVKALARDGQFRDDVPTSIIRGVVERETLPETLEWLCNVLTRQIESTEHDTQVAIWEAVGHPVWIHSPMGEVLRRCDMGGVVQRTHHWSPLIYDVDFVTTARDKAQRIYELPKDRHVLPWIEVNARFGIIERD
jgi:hypothetical protein